jgi:hypothetical protein
MRANKPDAANAGIELRFQSECTRPGVGEPERQGTRKTPHPSPLPVGRGEEFLFWAMGTQGWKIG